MDIHFLGAAGAVPYAQSDTTMLSVQVHNNVILLDCSGSVIYRLNDLQIAWHSLSTVCLSHRHIDHLFGLPHLVQVLQLSGREKPLAIYGSSDVLDLIRELLTLFNLGPDSLPFLLELNEVPLEHGASLLYNDGALEIWSCPVNHSVPALAYKIKDIEQTKVVVYSGDTGPCPKLIPFSDQADLLVHEATLLLTAEKDAHAFHSNVADAARIAAGARVKELCLVHFGADPEPLQQQIQREVSLHFNGPLHIGPERLTLSLLNVDR